MLISFIGSFGKIQEQQQQQQSICFILNFGGGKPIDLNVFYDDDHTKINTRSKSILFKLIFIRKYDLNINLCFFYCNKIFTSDFFSYNEFIYASSRF